jgi:hypothetical protein
MRESIWLLPCDEAKWMTGFAVEKRFPLSRE